MKKTIVPAFLFVFLFARVQASCAEDAPESPSLGIVLSGMGSGLGMGVDLDYRPNSRLGLDLGASTLLLVSDLRVGMRYYFGETRARPYLGASGGWFVASGIPGFGDGDAGLFFTGRAGLELAVTPRFFLGIELGLWYSPSILLDFGNFKVIALLPWGGTTMGFRF